MTRIVLSLLTLGAVAAASGDPAPVRLDALLAEARDASPMIRAARAEADAAAARVAGASRPGEVMVEGARTESPAMRSTMLGARLDLPFPGSSILAGRAASLAARAAAERARAVELDVLARIRTAYYRLARAAGTLAAAEQARDFFRQAAAVAKARAVTPARGRTSGAPASPSTGMGGMGASAPSGDATADYLLLEAEAARMNPMVVMQANERTVAEAELAELLGRPRDRSRIGTAVLPDLPEPSIDPDRLVDRALARSPELLAARSDAAAAGAEAGQMAIMMLPMVSPFYQAERFEMGGTGRTIGVALSYPIWFWKPAAAWREAVAMRTAKRADAAAREAEVTRMVREEVSETRAHWSAAVEYRDAVVPLLDQAVRSARGSYEAGRTDVLRLLAGMQQWLSATTDYYDEAYQYGEHRAALERTVGEPIEEVRSR